MLRPGASTVATGVTIKQGGLPILEICRVMLQLLILILCTCCPSYCLSFDIILGNVLISQLTFLMGILTDFRQLCTARARFGWFQGWKHWFQMVSTSFGSFRFMVITEFKYRAVNFDPWLLSSYLWLSEVKFYKISFIRAVFITNDRPLVTVVSL